MLPHPEANFPEQAATPIRRPRPDPRTDGDLGLASRNRSDCKDRLCPDRSIKLVSSGRSLSMTWRTFKMQAPPFFFFPGRDDVATSFDAITCCHFFFVPEKMAEWDIFVLIFSSLRWFCLTTGKAWRREEWRRTFAAETPASFTVFEVSFYSVWRK